MVREDIVGMMRIATQKGKNLQQTVQSLYNSGYPKNEVDAAVQVLNTYTFQPAQQPAQKVQSVQQPKPQPAQQGQTQQIVSAYPSPTPYQQYPQPFPQPPQPMQFYQPQPYPVQFQPQIGPSPQIISNYEQAKKPPIGKMITIIMIAMLAALIGVLVIVFLFKPELENFINNL